MGGELVFLLLGVDEFVPEADCLLHFLFNEGGDFGLQLGEVGGFDGGDGDVDDVAQDEVVEVDGAHGGQVGEDAQGDLEGNAGQLVVEDGGGYLLGDHLEHLHGPDEYPDVLAVHRTVGEVQLRHANHHVHQRPKQKLTLVPLLRLQSASQHLVVTVLLLLPLLTYQMVRHHVH